jgi:hypothetical protein
MTCQPMNLHAGLIGAAIALIGSTAMSTPMKYGSGSTISRPSQVSQMDQTVATDSEDWLQRLG